MVPFSTPDLSCCSVRGRDRAAEGESRKGRATVWRRGVRLRGLRRQALLFLSTCAAGRLNVSRLWGRRGLVECWARQVGSVGGFVGGIK
jgi:hypothetical protein